MSASRGAKLPYVSADCMSREDTPPLTTGDCRPRIIPSDEHCISSGLISSNALDVLHRLHAAGYQAFLVGGGVRDLLLGCKPKDFDVVTDARPNQIRALFRNCLLIGRRFRLAHVRFRREIIEVSTFRAAHLAEDNDARCDQHGRILRDNRYGSIDEDVWRRDFTVNALFYDIRDSSVLDYVDGMCDLKARRLRLIGAPRQRYTEDPVRMLRALRFAAKLDFHIAPESEAVFPELSHLLSNVSRSRLFDETLKLFMGGAALRSYEVLRRYNLFRYLFPQTDAVLVAEGVGSAHAFIASALRSTDSRLLEGKSVTAGFFIASLLWPPLYRLWQQQQNNTGKNTFEGLNEAVCEVLSRQVSALSFPKRINAVVRDIWRWQYRLEFCRKRRGRNLVGLRAAYDFMQLRQQAGEEHQAILAHWLPMYEEAIRTSGMSRRTSSRRRGRRRVSVSG